ncbi:MAG TPA: hypothetical protein VNL39_08340 [Xanthobacteraceae bacterium]|nr:hypothetical protein [Xanthobacteraceae bacterium]
MSNTSVPVSRVGAGDFRVGRVFDRTTAIYSRNFLPFSLVALISSLPPLLLGARAGDPTPMMAQSMLSGLVIVLLSVAFALLSQAILVYAAFQDMRGRAVNLSESINVALVRFLPILGLAIINAFGIGIGLMLFIIPGLILLTMWFVGVPACMVEQLGPWQSLKRSSQLTKGHRWKLFGAILLVYLAAAIISQVITLVFTAVAGFFIGLVATLAWNTVWGAFFATFVVVTYYELRSAKEGVDVEQIAAVFD